MFWNYYDYKGPLYPSKGDHSKWEPLIRVKKRKYYIIEIIIEENRNGWERFPNYICRIKKQHKEVQIGMKDEKNKVKISTIEERRIDMIEEVEEENIYESPKKIKKGSKWGSHPAGSSSLYKREEKITCGKKNK